MAFALRPLLTTVLVLAPSVARAAIIGSCTIVVQDPGTLKNNPGIDVLDSTQFGGQPATATVTPSSLLCTVLNLLDCYSISAPAPSTFTTAPGTGGDNVSFVTSFRLDGGAVRPGNSPVRVPNGSYAMEIDLTATKNTGIFSAGNYSAQFLVRCE